MFGETATFGILVDGRVLPVEFERYVQWRHDNPHAFKVAHTVVESRNTTVSTVFLGIAHDHRAPTGLEHIWFETLCFGGDSAGFQQSYSDIDMALQGHEAVVFLVKAGKVWNGNG